jgi:hypothetical protein
MAALPDEYRAIIVDQQVKLTRLVKDAGLGPVRQLYQGMLADLEKRLRTTPAGTMTHMQVRGMLAQVKIGLSGVLRQMAGRLGDAAYQVGIASARSMLQDVAKLEKIYTGALMPLPVLEAARLHGLAKDEASSLLRVHKESMARYGVEVVQRMEMSLAGSLASGETQAKAIDRVMQVGDMEWWRAERIVRTELAYASSATARRATNEQAAELDGDLWCRWSEHVSDDGVKLDDRVGVDSEALNGQVAPPGGVFVQPPRAPDGEAVGDSLVGKEWAHPPNRPNDRAVLAPWRFHWGIPGWVWRGRRVPVTERMVREANAKYVRTARVPEIVTQPAPQPVARPIARKAAPPPAPEPTIAPAPPPAPSSPPTPVQPPAPVAVAPSSAPVAPAPEIITVPTEKKNPKRVEAAKKAAEASAERRREIHSAVKSNLPQELQVAWEKEGHKFMQQEAARIRGVKDRINASSKLSEAFAEKYGSGGETAFGNEGDRFQKRAEIEAVHAETWANEQEREYYEAAQKAALLDGDIDENGELTAQGRAKHAAAKPEEDWTPPPAAKIDDDDPPF